MDSWKSIKLPNGSKLFKVHHFTFMFKGVNYALEVDEYTDGLCSGHGEHSTDKNFFIESVSGDSITKCLAELVTKIQNRVK